MWLKSVMIYDNIVYVNFKVSCDEVIEVVKVVNVDFFIK